MCNLSIVISLNFGCYNQSQIEMIVNNIAKDILSSVNQEYCHNKSNSESVVAFNYYHKTNICERFYNYSLTYRVSQNNLSEMCILRLPDNQKSDLMSCSMRNSVWDQNAITIAGLQRELDRPYAVVMSKNTSSLFIADTFHHQVVEYDLNSQTYIRVYSSIDGETIVHMPIALTLTDDDSQLLISNFNRKNILLWLLPNNSSKVVVASRYTGYISIAIDRSNIVYASEHVSSFVQSYDISLDLYWNYADWSYEDGYGTRHILIINDDIYIVQSQLCRVIKVSLTDQNQTITVVAGSSRIGSTSDRLRFPWGVAVDRIEGHVFVSDSRNHRIQLWLVNATKGITIGGINGRPGSDANQLNLPRGLTLGHDGSVFVADTKNSRIQKFQRYCLT